MGPASAPGPPAALNGAGGIESVINGTGAAVSPSNGGQSDLVSYS